MLKNYEYQTACGKFKSGIATESAEQRMLDYCKAHGLEPLPETLVWAESVFAPSVERFVKKNVKRVMHPTALELWDNSNWSLIKARQKIEQARYDELVAGGKEKDGKQLCQLHTPPAIVDELFRESGAYEAGSILVPGAGDGSFSVVAAQRNNRMDTLVEIDNSMMDGIHHLIGSNNVVIINDDFLTHDFGDYKPEVVIGNPPFQKEGLAGRGTGNSPFWAEFLNRAAQLNPETIAMILPSSWKGESYKKFLPMLSCYGCVYNRAVKMKSEWQRVGRPCSVVVFKRGVAHSVPKSTLLEAALADGEKVVAKRAEGYFSAFTGSAVAEYSVVKMFRGISVQRVSGLVEAEKQSTKGYMRTRYVRINGERMAGSTKVLLVSGTDEFFASGVFKSLCDEISGTQDGTVTEKDMCRINLEFARTGWRKYENQEAS